MGETETMVLIEPVRDLIVDATIFPISPPFFFSRVCYALRVEANRREEFLNASKFSIQTENIPIEMQNKCRTLLSILRKMSNYFNSG